MFISVLLGPGKSDSINRLNSIIQLRGGGCNNNNNLTLWMFFGVEQRCHHGVQASLFESEVVSLQKSKNCKKNN